MDPLENVPVKILGYSVKTRWQITLNYLIPCIVELLVFLSVMVVDGALVYQHLLDKNYLWAWHTLGIVFIPPVLTFVCILMSDQWPIETGFGREKRIFLARQIMNLFLFPICATYRFSRKIFWCVDSLFHERNTYERHHAMAKAAEASPFELYHFLQSFFHCAPQIILQLFILLRDDMFRNYDTAFVQGMCVIFNLIKMSMTAESYQRFESQKVVGKNYPWLAPHQVVTRSTTFRRTLSAPGEEIVTNANNSSNIMSQEVNERKSMNVDKNNFNETSTKKNDEATKKIDFVSNITDDDKLYSMRNKVDTHRPSTSTQRNVPDDDLLDNIEEIKEYLRRTAEVDEVDEIDTPPVLRNTTNEDNFDRIPSIPPPPRPKSHSTLNRLSTFKDMLIFEAESFIKAKVPRIPEGMFEHYNKVKEHQEKEKTMNESTSAQQTLNIESHDDVDALLMPKRRKVVDGIESDDIVAKFISFLGWNFFLIMRLISLSVFSVFYPAHCLWLCFAHYVLMLLCLINETRFTVKWQRTAFYTVLAYIFIFNLIEFKIRFRHVRYWYTSYFVLVMAQNIGMTIAWFGFTDFLDNWWFEFMFLVTLQSGIMSLMCFLLYFCYLKPQDKVFFVNE
ncbi:hypothetical protein PVAND_000287 [Polypedilum vanderplanki]|uniref:XK-related protein n=1 Tax=Polypedilum vanderplanki TaxID=319348 RepID=A0A9J6BK81_POLVA|nr:hypothetical protein PVAND_000287 [Polypedilum vanderplanki]